MIIEKISKEASETLREVIEAYNKEKAIISIEIREEIDRMLQCDTFDFYKRGEYLLFCSIVLASVRAKNIEQIQQLKGENEALKKMVDEQEKIISTYNGSYLQRTKVINGMKIAKKGNVTKEAIQQLKGKNLTIEQIAEKLGCSRTTVWRRLKE